jgi:ABC-type glutathione transport system ATPase component
MSKIEIDNLSVDYAVKDGQPFTALSDISFTVDDGEFVAVIGSSGSGKSTLLSVLHRIIDRQIVYFYFAHSPLLSSIL